MTYEELVVAIKKYNDGIDGINESLVKAIEDYQREYERALSKINFQLSDGALKTNLSNYAKAMSFDAFNKLGFQQIGIDHIAEYDNIATDRIEFLKKMGLSLDMTFKDIEIIKKLKELDLGALFLQGQALDNAVKKALVNSIATGASYQQTIDSISTDLLGAGDTTGDLAKYASTYMSTAINGLSNMVSKEIYDSVGGFDKYIYAGPIDGKTREFCLEHVGNEYTEEEIAQFPIENESGLDPWFSPGGWNCRHELIPSSSIK